MQHKKLVTTLFVLSVIFITSITAFAATADTTAQTTDTTTPATVTALTAQDQNLANALGETYNLAVTAQNVADMHAAGIGYGEISKAYGFAALSGKSVSDIMSMKQSMGWGEIAKNLGVKVSDITKSDEAVQHAMNKVKGNDKATTSQKGHAANHSSSSGHGSGGGNGGGHGGGHH